VEATPEMPIPFDLIPGEPRNADIGAVAIRDGERIAITVEAKADEPFDKRIGDLLGGAFERTWYGGRTRSVERLEQLVRALLPPRGGHGPHLADLRYQLLTAVAGSLALARCIRAGKAVLLIHEFDTWETKDENLLRNQRDLNAFVCRLTSGIHTQLKSGELIGPISVPGCPLFDEPVPVLYMGKARVRVERPG
jgi:hypothetical protein